MAVHEANLSFGSFGHEKRPRGESHVNSDNVHPTVIANRKSLPATYGDMDGPNLGESTLDGLEDDSPYPEARSAVANTDDPDMPVSTIRAWFLGMLMAIVVPGVDQREPQFSPLIRPVGR
ncbi:uncharacterized protein EI90DRAFT_3065276 [Cantharellus anzutake]|uniref:uncharacterized protein n=1 Tax=Cantharellus anzutake TaxID=1750568 RepID=UPI001905C98E|nr:uncharacterized protein EI90DRAFT_3065276 [Cantharellus anzutake]KAF8328431.1 hypothetical protein EI90DRAFT_3065276 [Cantharellus anzutake]